jgi:leader peptidase (prepilin peptidase)/N-methyltransferase
MNIPFILLATVAGVLVGGLINWLADDLPYGLRLRPPHYRDGRPRPPQAWLGLMALLTGTTRSPRGLSVKRRQLLGRARRCRRRSSRAPKPLFLWYAKRFGHYRRRSSQWAKPLTLRYPAVELTTAAFFAYLAATHGPTRLTIFWMGIMALLILITVIDLEHRLILYSVILPGCLYALAGAALLGPEIAPRVTFADYLIGGALGFVVFLLLYLGGFLFSGALAHSRGQALNEVAFGYGDVMLATLSGFILGWQALIFAVFIAVFAGAAGALLFIMGSALLRGRYDLFTALPYGQYIVFGTVVMLLWRGPILRLLQGG